MRERDVAFGKLAIARGLVSREAMSECFRAATAGGRSLRDELVGRRLLDPRAAAELEALAAGAQGTPSSGTPSSGSWAAVSPPSASPPPSAPASFGLSPLAPGATPPPAPTAPTARASSGRAPAAGGPEALPQPGELVGSYRIAKLLGKGGMGAVYLARDEGTQADVALKLVLDASDEGFLARFRREIESTAKLDHPNVVRIHTSGAWGRKQLPFAVLELVPGTDLSKRLKTGPLPVERTCELMEKVSRALHHAHERKILHRDLKPANILLREPGEEPVVSDFGLARDESRERLTRSGEALGTPAYMAPEQAEGLVHEQDARTDVYGLGAILYECLTGHPPFEADSNVRLLKKVLLDDPVDPGKLVPGLPRDVAVVTLRCLAKDRQHRYATALELAEELGRVRAGEPILARPVGRFEAWKRRAKRNPSTAVMSAVIPLALAVGAVGGWFVYRQRVAQGEERKAANDARETAVAAVSSALRGLGYPLVAAPSDTGAARTLLETARARDEAARALGAIDPEATRRLEGCTRWLELLAKPTEPARAAAAEAPILDRTVEAAAALRALAEKPEDAGARAALEQRLAALPEKLPAREALEGLGKIVDGRGRDVGTLAQVVGRLGTLDAAESAPFSAGVERAFVQVLAKASAGGEVGDVAALAAPFERARRTAPGLPATLRATLANAGEDALAAWLGSKPVTLARQKDLVQLVLAIDPEARGRDPSSDSLGARERALARELDRLLAADLKGSVGKQISATGDLALRVGNLLQLTSFVPSTIRLQLEAMQYALVSGEGSLAGGSAGGLLSPRKYVEFMAPLLRSGSVLLASTNKYRIEDLGDLPRQLVEEAKKESDPAKLLAVEILVLETAEKSAGAVDHMDDQERQARLELEAARAALDYVRRQAYVFEAFRRSQAPDYLRAIERVVWGQALLKQLVTGKGVSDQPTVDQTIEACEEALRLGHPLPHVVELVLGEAYLDRSGIERFAGKEDDARKDAERAAEHFHRAWDLYERNDARARELKDHTDSESESELYVLNSIGFYGSTVVDPGVRLKPLWSEAEAHIRLAELATDAAQERAQLDRALESALRGCQLYDGNHMWQWRVAGLLESAGRFDEALVHAARAIPRANEEGLRDDKMPAIIDCWMRLQFVVAESRK